MERELWINLLMSGQAEEAIWEVFHENSKISEYHQAPPDHYIRAQMENLHESLYFEGYPHIDLPRSLVPLRRTLEDVIFSRSSALTMSPSPLSLRELATILHGSYGVTRDNKGTRFPRPFRVVPSGGALYPLELFFYTAHVDGLESGVYHYNPTQHCVRFLGTSDSEEIAELATQPNVSVIKGASVVLFITAMFQRSVFKYGDRGYRFVLMEAGHVAQNMNLVSQSLGMGSLNIGGFYDRMVDKFLGLDGVTQSTIYMVAIGQASV